MQTIERKQPGKGRKNRVGVSLETSLENDLNKLAISCGMAPTTLAYVLLSYCLNHSEIVYKVQSNYNKSPEYWVFHVTAPDGKRRLEVKR